MARFVNIPLSAQLKAGNIPVLVGTVPLFAVSSFVITEGYKTASIANSTIAQMVAPTTKTVTIEALLVGPYRLMRPLLEAMALTSRLLASAVAPLMKVAGVP